MRQVLPELLDSLPSCDPAAVQSRDELRLINRIMGNHRWLCRALKHQATDGERVLELGAGDGTLARRAWSEAIIEPDRWSSLDLAPAPAQWPSDAPWHQCDVLTLPMLPDGEIILANLFLHHFQDDQLAALGRRVPGDCRLFLACEPVRHWRHLLQGRALSAIAELSAVTHHDMLASIRAGFLKDELSHALGFKDWHTTVSLTTLGAYRFTAWR